MCTTCLVPWRSEDGVEPSGIAFTDGCVPPVGADNLTWIIYKSKMFFKPLNHPSIPKNTHIFINSLGNKR